jgi:predicted nucleic acid-binding protein
MRLVVDTNIFVSAALKAVSWPAGTLRWISRARSPSRKFWRCCAAHASPRRSRPLFSIMYAGFWPLAELVSVEERLAVCRDPDDDKFLELAVNGNADVIVSGDADLLALDTFRGIPIITTAAFGASRVR